VNCFTFENKTAAMLLSFCYLQMKFLVYLNNKKIQLLNNWFLRSNKSILQVLGSRSPPDVTVKNIPVNILKVYLEQYWFLANTIIVGLFQHRDHINFMFQTSGAREYAGVVRIMHHAHAGF
jgi:hypothetical protein